jgi:hypothetical protein
LKRALARKDPEPGFGARLSARSRGGRPGTFSRRWLAAAASVLVLAGSGAAYRHYEGVRAKDKVMLAVRLAGGKLNQVQNRVLGVAK